jgi:hypothetical protein
VLVRAPIESRKVVDLPVRKARRFPPEAILLAADAGESVAPLSIRFGPEIELRIERARDGGLELQLIDEEGRESQGPVEVIWELENGEERTRLVRFGQGVYEGRAEERLWDEAVGTLRLRVGDDVLDEAEEPRRGR